MSHGRIIAAGALLGLFGATPALAQPQEFLTKAIKGDNSEMRLGSLAAQRGTSPAVRQFGQMLEQDHRAAKQDAMRVARNHRIAAPSAMMPEAAAEYRRLSGMSGREFDREFARYMADDHRKDIADFTQEAASRDPADIRDLARRTLPNLRKHLRTAQSLG
jgi:putative membrane protein